MNKTIHILFILLFATTGYAQKKEKIKGNKVVTTLSKEINTDFNSLEISDNLHVQIRQDQKNSYALTTDENLQEVVQFAVQDSVLRIFTTHQIQGSKKLAIALHVKYLKNITLNNTSEVKSEGALESDELNLIALNNSAFELDIETKSLNISLQNNAGGKFSGVAYESTTIEMSNRSDLKGDLTTEKLSASLGNSAQLKLVGETDEASFTLENTAELDARKMKAIKADLYAANNSDIYVQAKKDLAISAKGKSNIYVYGNPELGIKSLADKSKIIKK